ncbi:AMP-binding protein, partial [Rhizobium ruizarguesonis]|uniref:AMP-binding protein n=2 Tax=Pseudomonadati TaxID=3379134 RepID=UPI0013B9BE12
RSQRFSFQELKERSLHAARFLTGLGLKRGDRVFILMPRVPEWWFLVLGCIRAGIVFMPGTPMLTAKDIRYRLEVAGAKAVLTDGSCLDRFEGVLDQAPGVTTWVSTGDAPSPWTRYVSEALPESQATAFPPTRSDDPLLIY